MELCEDCGFCWIVVPRAEIVPRTIAAAAAIVGLLMNADDTAKQRPQPERWSTVEYGAHVRDVLLTMRDRLVIGIVEDDPGFKPMYKDERIDLGLYAADTATAVAKEVDAAAAMFARLFTAIDPSLLGRPVQYGFPGPMPRTLLWMGQQAIHETEHHLTDIRENISALRK
jgi:DinB superfamily